MPSVARTCAFLLPLTLALAACGQGTPEDDQGETPAESGAGSTLTVISSFYPLEWLTQEVAGDLAEVSVLTSPGADPHDVELTPRTVGSIGSADLVIYSAGMQDAVDDAVSSQAIDHALDVAPSADLLAAGEDTHAHDEHAEEEEGHDHGPEDPHFWLDPERYGHVAEAIAQRLGEVDPDNAQEYTDNAADVVSELTSLDEEFAGGLQTCESRDLVTTHEAFGYLAQRYDLNQMGITGISPEAEPSPARLAEVSSQVDRLGVTTIYAEPILTDAIASTIARETGTRVLTLDPLEGVTDASAGEDYLEIMRANLESLREGLGCS